MSETAFVVAGFVAFLVGAIQVWAAMVVIGIGARVQRMDVTLDNIERTVKQQLAAATMAHVPAPSEKLRQCPGCKGWVQSAARQCEACHAALPADPF